MGITMIKNKTNFKKPENKHTQTDIGNIYSIKNVILEI